MGSKISYTELNTIHRRISILRDFRVIHKRLIMEYMFVHAGSLVTGDIKKLIEYIK